MRTLWMCALLCVASLTHVSPAAAQTNPAQSSVSVAIGSVSFDADSLATTVGVAGRAAAALTPRLAIEGHVSRVRTDDPGGSTLWVVEGHVQYFWRAGERLRPYAGGGAGLYMNEGLFLTDKSLTLSAAAGLRVDLADRIAALGEFRFRGVDIPFSGSLAEIWGGITIRLGR
jgi:hypothetical protein